MKLAAKDGDSVWAATHSSDLHRWDDIPTRWLKNSPPPSSIPPDALFRYAKTNLGIDLLPREEALQLFEYLGEKPSGNCPVNPARQSPSLTIAGAFSQNCFLVHN